MNPYILIMAVLSLATGLILYIWLVRGNVSYFYSTNVVSWLLIALFPVLLIFSFFSEPSFSDSIKGAAMGGAIGAFIFIWWYGTKVGTEAPHRQLVERIARVAESKAQEEPEKAKPAWDLARVKMEAYFDRNLSQINSIFWLSAIVMVVGFVIIMFGILQAIQSPDTLMPTAITSAAGVITEFIGATFLFIYRSTIQQASEYSKTLERINSVGMAMQILDTMPDEAQPDDLKSKTKASLAELLVQQAHEVEKTGGNEGK